MRSRLLAWTILVFQAFFLNIVVPGHQRGIVQLPGAVPSAQQGRCPFCAGDSSTADTKTNKSHAPAGDRENCAICFIAAHLSLPPVFTISLEPLHLLGSLPACWREAIIARNCRLAFDERGPPLPA